MRFVIYVVMVLVLAGCPAAICQSTEMRCAENVSQICDAQGRWQEVADCSQTEPGEWTCVVRDDESTCERNDER